MPLDDQRRMGKLEAQMVEMLRRLSNQPVRWPIAGATLQRPTILFFDDPDATNELIVPAGIRDIWIAMVAGGGGGGFRVDKDDIEIQNSTTVIGDQSVGGGGGGGAGGIFGLLKVKVKDELIITLGNGGIGGTTGNGADGTDSFLTINAAEKARAKPGRGGESSAGGSGGGVHTITIDPTRSIVEMVGSGGRDGNSNAGVVGSGGNSFLGGGGHAADSDNSEPGRGGGGSAERTGGDGEVILIF